MSQKSMDKIIALAKRRGFVYPTAEIYGGFRSSYDYGPLGSLMLRNVREAWIRANVQQRESVGRFLEPTGPVEYVGASTFAGVALRVRLHIPLNGLEDRLPVGRRVGGQGTRPRQPMGRRGIRRVRKAALHVAAGGPVSEAVAGS